MFKKTRKTPTDERARARPAASDLGSNRSLNRFGLNLSQTTDKSADNALQPLASPSYEEVPMWTVLPSYQLFTSTFSKNLTPTDEDLRNLPPLYEPSSDYFPTEPATGASDHSWENSILANTHKLKRLSDTTPKKSSGLAIKSFITKSPCKAGVPPVIADPDHEYSQGDDITGYVTMLNTTNADMSYDMFWVVLEGKISVLDTSDKTPVVYYKFLNMFDYDASWSPVCDYDGPQTDSVDGAKLTLREDRIFEPGTLYKKFFSFRIPDKLLECACEVHDLSRHSELHPTIGLARDQFLQSMRKLRERNTARQKGSADFALTPVKSNSTPGTPKKPSNFSVEKIKDMSFPDTAISYSVEARVVAKASEYSAFAKSPTDKNEFIIVDESSSFFRVVPRERIAYEYGNASLEAESRVLYENLLNRINEKIQLGRDLVSEGHDITSTLGRSLSISKSKQLYVGGKLKDVPSSKTSSSYSISAPIKKKQTLTSVPKPVGILTVSTPKAANVLPYISPFTSKISKKNTKLTFPMELNFTTLDPKSAKSPEIKAICAELVVFTFRSKKYPVSVEITPELVYKNNGSPTDNFETNVCKPFKKHLEELVQLIQELNNEVLAVDSQLISDMKSLGDLQSKAHHIKIDEVTTRYDTPWIPDSQDKETCKRTCKVTVDIRKIVSREPSGSFDDFQKVPLTLVPSFQSCILGRLYFINLIIKVHNEHISLKVPFSIES